MKVFATVVISIAIFSLLSACGGREETAESLQGIEKFESYYPGGQKESEGRLKNGRMNGKWLMWYENGQIEREESYKDDLLHGRKATWYENGRIREEAWYREGKLHGRKIVWDEKGNILTVIEYKDGVEVSRIEKGEPKG